MVSGEFAVENFDHKTRCIYHAAPPLDGQTRHRCAVLQGLQASRAGTRLAYTVPFASLRSGADYGIIYRL